MKRKFILLIRLAAVFIAVSFAGTPPLPAQTVSDGSGPVPSTSPPSSSTAPDQSTLSSLNDAAARAAAARKLAGDFDASSFLPSDWEAAESLFNQAEQQKDTTTMDGAQGSLDRYTKAAEAYDALVGAYYNKVVGELNDARVAAIDVGAGELVPDYLLEVDNVVDDAEGKYQAKDYSGAKAAAGDALSRYLILKEGLDAYNVREEIADMAEELVPDYLQTVDTIGLDAIDKWEAQDYSGAKAGADAALSMYLTLRNGIVAYILREEVAERAEELVPDALLQADNVGLDAIAKWEANDFEGAKVGADKALTMFSGLSIARDAYDLRESILSRAEVWFPDFLSQADNVGLDAIDMWVAEDYSSAKDIANTALIIYLVLGASTERQTAIDHKANMAVRREFFTAEALFNQANAAYNEQSYKEAATLYEECMIVFKMTTQLVLEMQRVAEEAIKMADRKAAESDNAARNAETILQGGMR